MYEPERATAGRPRGPAGWQRHLSGWQAGGVIVACAVATAALVSPLPVPPTPVPLPAIDRRVQHQQLLEDQQRAQSALAGLPPSVEKVAIALRRLGQADVAARPSATLKKQLWRLVRAARNEAGDEALLALRARQGQQLISASRASQPHDATTRHRDELQALGGQLYRDGRQRGWFNDTGFVDDERTLAVLFKIHWSRATGLQDTHPFSPSLTDWKIYYRFLLASPVAEGVDPALDARRKLALVRQLRDHDAQYPSLLAEGILWRHANKPGQALGALTAYEEKQGQGRWSIRARNQIAGCLTPTRTIL